MTNERWLHGSMCSDGLNPEFSTVADSCYKQFANKPRDT